ncbi:ATP-dependent DNA ligase [Bradyrhizobium sp. JR18.2]
MPSALRITETPPRVCRAGEAPPRKKVEHAYFPACVRLCLPTKGIAVPDGSDWLHEVKYDGYRLRLERDGDRVRLITRGGYNWASRYPWIVEAASKIR